MKLLAVVLQLVGLLGVSAGLGLLFGTGAYLTALGGSAVVVGAVLEREHT